MVIISIAADIGDTDGRIIYVMKDLTILKIMWPALILAARRNANVRGRTRDLIISTVARNAAIMIGVPSGRSFANLFIGVFHNLIIIMASHAGAASLKVTTR